MASIASGQKQRASPVLMTGKQGGSMTLSEARNRIIEMAEDSRQPKVKSAFYACLYLLGQVDGNDEEEVEDDAQGIG